ncbi:MAG: DUF523 domain-containing protein [Myxococcota bacterium]|nr:DUF523 domain-containing protein [Myxococcota bacterium]
MSRCLTGIAVRYDGRHKSQDWLDALAQHVSFVDLCPEVDAGHPVPRPPIDVYLTPSGTMELRESLDGIDKSSAIRSLSLKWKGHLSRTPVDGVVLKAHSPSCAIDNAVYFDAESGRSSGRGPGMFAKTILSAHPSLPRADEQQLQTAEHRMRFKAEVLVHNRLRRNQLAAGDCLPLRRLVEGICPEGDPLELVDYTNIKAAVGRLSRAELSTVNVWPDGP